MIVIRKSDQRFHTEIGWLDSWHTFSFGDHYHPGHLGFRALRVINEDRVAPGQGFPTHPHRDMEILSYVLEGALGHQDSMGHGSVIRPGDVQRMTAGTGVLHSEQNAAPGETTHFLQIWIIPQRRGLEPGYEQRAFPEAERRGRLRLVAARDGREGAITVHQDAALYAALLAPGERVSHALAPGRHAWVQVARGGVQVGREILAAGDGAAVSDEPSLDIAATAPAEILVFDLA
jgi:redox-sensitive bicupin YhaK (pirin superfamily)